MNESKLDKVLIPVSPEINEERDEKVRSEFWPKFKKFAAKLPLAEDFAAAYYCATDKSTPLKVRGTLLAALAYFIMPIDLVPDFLVFVVFTDDIAVLTAALTMVQSNITDEHRKQAQKAISEMSDN